MSLVKRLYKSRQYVWDGLYTGHYEYYGPVVELVEELEKVCAEKGLSLSRWETNLGKYKKRITWAVHKGERKSQFRYMSDDQVINAVVLWQMEGKTRSCEAYRQLSRLYDSVVRYP